MPSRYEFSFDRQLARRYVLAMLAYKFLRHDQRGVHTGWRWPVGEWVESAEVDPCRSGIHACEVDDVAWWLADELWVIELEGTVARARHKVVARRGRLVHVLDAYRPAVRELGEVSAQRTRDRAIEGLRTHHASDVGRQLASASSLGELRAVGTTVTAQFDDTDPAVSLAMLSIDAAVYAVEGEPSEAPFIASCAAGVAATMVNPARSHYEDAFGAERQWQSHWLAERLALR